MIRKFPEYESGHEYCSFTGEPFWYDEAGYSVKEGTRVRVHAEDGTYRDGVVSLLNPDADGDDGQYVDCSTLFVLLDGDHEDKAIRFERWNPEGLERLV